MGFLDQLGNVQQCLGRNAAAIEANPARVSFWVNERYVHAEISGEKGSGVSTGTAANDCDFQVRTFGH